MGFLTDHQHTAITDTIDRVVSSQSFTLEVELASLLQMIRASSEYTFTNNQLETARCIRKKLKYGNTLQQSRSLDLLNLFVSQLVKLPVVYNDVKLLERLQGIAMRSSTDAKGARYDTRIVKKCVGYILAWARFIQDQLQGSGSSKTYDGLLTLGGVVQRNYIKKTERARGSSSRSRGNFMSDEADASIHPADAMYRIPQIAMDKEAPRIRLLISDSLATAISLENSLMALGQSVSSTDDEECTAKFIQARAMRRKVLRYLQLVTSGEFLGSLIRANEELVAALSKYDELSGRLSDEESSEYENGGGDDDDDEEEDDQYSNFSEEIAPEEEADQDNPFGDQNKI